MANTVNNISVSKFTNMQFRYTMDMYYLNIVRNVNTQIKNECIKYIIIDHEFDSRNMPIIYVNISLDRSLIDDMILNTNDNLILLSLYKYDDLTDMKTQELVFRKKFIYFLANDVNANDAIDYSETTEAELKGDTYTNITMGLLALDHVNNNKKSVELNMENNTIFDGVKYITSHMDNLIVEPFVYNDTFEQIIMPPQNSVSKALQFLNDYRVFYNTPYRYYQDFNYTYILSSNGRAISKSGELYSNILIDIREITDNLANDIGQVDNKTNKTYQVPVSYAFTQVYDNSVINKSKNKLKGISNSGVYVKTLRNNASYSDNKVSNIRLNNDNDNMILNLEAQSNNDNYVLFFTKNDLDTDLFTINKSISIHNIDRYQSLNGDYILNRKREMYVREDQTFTLVSMITLSRLMESSDDMRYVIRD